MTKQVASPMTREALYKAAKTLGGDWQNSAAHGYIRNRHGHSPAKAVYANRNRDECRFSVPMEFYAAMALGLMADDAAIVELASGPAVIGYDTEEAWRKEIVLHMGLKERVIDYKALRTEESGRD